MKVLVVIVLVALLVAGCSQDAAPAPDPRVAAAEAAARALPADADADHGVVRGFVLDQDGDPVTEATVTVTPPRVDVRTTAEGAFAVGGLEPGRHVLFVNKPGSDEVQVTVEVVAGDAQPEPVRIDLVTTYIEPGVVSLDQVGYLDTMVADQGIITHGTGYAPLEEGATVVQVEFHWVANSPFTETLEATIASAGPALVSKAGPSPLVLRTDGSLADGKYASIQAFLDLEDPDVKLGLEQEYDIRIDVFYGFTPRADWTYGKDGPYPVPA